MRLSAIVQAQQWLKCANALCAWSAPEKCKAATRGARNIGKKQRGCVRVALLQIAVAVCMRPPSSYRLHAGNMTGRANWGTRQATPEPGPKSSSIRRHSVRRRDGHVEKDSGRPQVAALARGGSVGSLKGSERRSAREASARVNRRPSLFDRTQCRTPAPYRKGTETLSSSSDGEAVSPPHHPKRWFFFPY